MGFTESKKLLIVLLFFFILIAANHVALGQPPPPPAGGLPGSGHNLVSNQGASIGNGVWIMVSLSFSYLIFHMMRKKENTMLEKQDFFLEHNQDANRSN